MFNPFRKAVFAAACALVLTAGCGDASDSEKVVFAWPGAGSSTMAPFLYAQDLGYFKEQNIDLDIIFLQGAATVIPQMLAGKVFTSLIGPETVILSRQPDRPTLPIRFVYNGVRNSAWEISVLADSPIQSVTDLGGKTIGVGNLTFGNVPMTKAILKSQGVDLDTVEMVAVGVGAPAYEALTRKRIDALNLWDAQNAILRQQGVDIRIVPLPPEFKGVVSHALPVTEETLRDHPDLVVRFGRALAKGTVACRANPEGCLENYFRHYPRGGVSLEEAMRDELPVLQVRLANMSSWNEQQAEKWGSFSDRDFQVSINSLKVGGLLPADLEIDLGALYTNQFVDQFNDFDAAAVERQAKAFKP